MVSLERSFNYLYNGISCALFGLVNWENEVFEFLVRNMKFLSKLKKINSILCAISLSGMMCKLHLYTKKKTFKTRFEFKMSNKVSRLENWEQNVAGSWSVCHTRQERELSRICNRLGSKPASSEPCEPDQTEPSVSAS